jgi:spore germination protein GerM
LSLGVWSMRLRRVGVVLGVIAVLLGGALLRGWLVDTSRGDMAPEASGWRLRWPWTPQAEVTVFFPTPEGAQVSVRRTVAEATPLAALRELAAGPVPDSGLVPALPPGLVVEEVAVDGGIATVRVSGGEVGPEAAALMARSLASVTAVRVVMAEGRALDPVAVPPSSPQVTYLWRGRPVPVAAAAAADPTGAVRRLLEGPPPPGVDPMPFGLTLLGVSVDGDLAKVSLGIAPGVVEELVAGRWQFAPQAMAMVYTLTDQPGVRRVQFEFPDLPAAARRNCRTPLGVPLVRPDAEPGLAKGV